ncbi:MAG: hypothetical protein ABEI98_07250 [Halorhabdus sp.]
MPGRTVVVLVLLVGAVSVGTAVPGVQIGFGTDDVALDAEGTATLDIVVTSADAGVGSLELSVASNATETVRITDISVVGDPSFVATDVTGNGSTARASAAGLNRTASSLTVVRVSVAGVAPGATNLSLSITSIGDSAGHSYAVTDVDGTVRIVVGDSAERTGSEVDRTGRTTVASRHGSGVLSSYWLVVGTALVATAAGAAGYYRWRD